MRLTVEKRAFDVESSNRAVQFSLRELLTLMTLTAFGLAFAPQAPILGASVVVGGVMAIAIAMPYF